MDTACSGVISPSTGLALLKDLSDGVFPPVADLGELDKAHSDAQVDARADQQRQHHRSPDKVINSGNNFFIKYFEDLQS